MGSISPNFFRQKRYSGLILLLRPVFGELQEPLPGFFDATLFIIAIDNFKFRVEDLNHCS